MQRVQVADIYLQRWQERHQVFYKAYALLQIPEVELDAAQWIGKDNQMPEAKSTAPLTQAPSPAEVAPTTKVNQSASASPLGVFNTPEMRAVQRAFPNGLSQ